MRQPPKIKFWAWVGRQTPDSRPAILRDSGGRLLMANSESDALKMRSDAEHIHRLTNNCETMLVRLGVMSATVKLT